jgi:hypothetical protein
VIVAVTIFGVACGGGGGGGGGDTTGALSPFTNEPPPTLTVSVDDTSFHDQLVAGDAQAAVASVELVTGSARYFAVLQEGADAAPVSTSALEIDVGEWKLNFDEDSDADGLFAQPGAWIVQTQNFGPNDFRFYVQFEDAGGKVTKSFGDTRTDKVRVATNKARLGFLGYDLITITDAKWTISTLRAKDDIITLDGEGTVDLSFFPDFFMLIKEPRLDFSSVNLRIDPSTPESLRRPEAGRLRLRANNIDPFGDDIDFVVDFPDGSNDATVTVEGGICNVDFDWSISTGLPESFEIRHCLGS